MKFKFRNNANQDTWCSLLLPCCLFPFMIKFVSGIHILLFNICLCTLLVPKVQESKSNDCNWLGRNGYIFLLSLPPSLFIWNFFSYNLLLTYTLCTFGILYYSHLIKNLLVKCPGSFTYGEAQVLSQGVMLFALYCIVTLLSKVVELDNFSVIGAVPQSVICLQILLLGCILLVHTLCLLPSLRQGINFVFCCIAFSSLMMYAWHVTLKKNIFIWMWLYCLHDKKRVFLILFWLFSTFSSVTFVVWINWKPNYKASTLVRKYFHFIICIVYVPGVVYDLDLLRLASGIALTAFIVLEMFRILNVPTIGSAIQSAFEVFLDEKDSGVLILTNIYLLIGCSSPIWLAGFIFDAKGYHVCILSGVISVGLGDAAASVGGTFLGKHCWEGSNKTYEGSVCAFVTQLIASFYFLLLGHELSLYNITILIIAVLSTTLIEAKITEVDNLILPLFMFSFLSWIH